MHVWIGRYDAWRGHVCQMSPTHMNCHRFIGSFLAVAALLGQGCGPSPSSKSAAPLVPAVSVALPIPRKVNEWDEFTGRLASPDLYVGYREQPVSPTGVSGYLRRVLARAGG